MLDNLIEEITSRLNARIEKANEIKNRISTLEQEIQEINNKLNLPVIQYPNKKDFSLFSRIFKNSYKNAISTWSEKIEEQEKISDELREKRLEKFSEKKELESQLTALDVEKTNNLLENMQDRSKAIEVIINKRPELRENIDFMKEIVVEDIKNLQYDKTDNPELYSTIIEKTIELYKSGKIERDESYKKYVEENIEEWYSNILKPKQEIEGKYRIPLKFLYEAMRNKTKDGNKCEICVDGYTLNENGLCVK